MGRIKALILIIFIIVSAFSLNSCQEDTQYSTQEDTQYSTSQSPITLKELLQKQDAKEGLLNEIYRIDTKYINDDGSYIVVNFQSVKKYNSYSGNNETTINNVIVLENVPPIDITRNYVTKVAYFDAFDKYGKPLDVGDIYTQTGKEFSEIIIQVPKSDQCVFILVGGIDETTNSKNKLIFVVQ